jgi:hypothetical protein
MGSGAGLTVATWIWGTKYRGDYIARLDYGLRRNLRSPFRFIVLNPFAADMWLRDGCLCRMRLFDPGFQEIYGIKNGEHVAVLDLDIVITGRLDPLFERDESLVILAGANAANPCPFNGSVMMMTAGANVDLWADLNADVLQTIPRYEFPDDQGWIHFKRPNAATWQVGSSSGIYAFRKPGWPPGDELPVDARLVAFPGRRDPSQFTHLPWVKKFWS